MAGLSRRRIWTSITKVHVFPRLMLTKLKIADLRKSVRYNILFTWLVQQEYQSVWLIIIAKIWFLFHVLPCHISHLSAVLTNRGCPFWLEVSKRDAHLQAGPEAGFEELQACQPDLSAGEGYGADHLACLHTAYTGQPGDQAQPAWVYARQVLLDQCDLLWQGDLLSGWRKGCGYCLPRFQ